MGYRNNFIDKVTILLLRKNVNKVFSNQFWITLVFVQLSLQHVTIYIL